MANETHVMGNNLLFFIGELPVASSRSASISMNVALLDKTSKDSGNWAESLSGRKSWSGNCDGLIDYAGLGRLADAFSNGTRLEVSFGERNPIAGNLEFSGFAFIESLELNADQDDIATYTVSFTGDGELVKSVQA